VEEPPITKKLNRKKTDITREEKGGAEPRKSKSVSKVANALGGLGGLLGKGKGRASVVNRAMTMENFGQHGQEPGKAATNQKSGVALIDVGKLALKGKPITEINSLAKPNQHRSTVSFQPVGPDKNSYIDSPRSQGHRKSPGRPSIATIVDLNLQFAAIPEDAHEHMNPSIASMVPNHSNTRSDLAGVGDANLITSQTTHDEALAEESDEDSDAEQSEPKEWHEIVAELYGDHLCDLGKGIMFGELALSENKPRQATIMCKTECTFMIIKKEQFDIIKRFHTTEMNFRKDFLLKVMPKIEEINADKYVKDMLISLTNESYMKNQIVTRQGLEGGKVYLLRDGRCKITMRLKNGRVVNICEIGTGSVIGEECLFDSEFAYKYTITISSPEAKFLTINRRYCQTKIPFSVLEDLKISYDLKDYYRMRICGKLCNDSGELAKI
jgi:CRP-like cAMP-binding protein